jgi:hypothetical protein
MGFFGNPAGRVKAGIRIVHSLAKTPFARLPLSNKR